VKSLPLILNEDTRNEIRRVRSYAENHPHTFSQLKKIQEGIGEIPGDNPNHTCIVPSGYRCVFKIDQAVKKDGSDAIWLRHLSVSVGKDVWPNQIAVNELMEEFGFRQKLCDMNGKPLNSKIMVWLENEDDPNLFNAVNILETYDE